MEPATKTTITITTGLDASRARVGCSPVKASPVARRRRPGPGSGMHRFAVLSTMIVGIAGLGLLHAAPARSAAGCSIASAPVIASGAAQTSDPKACPDGRQYWAMNLQIGDALNVSIAPSGGSHIEFAVYGPDVQTIGGPLCAQAYGGPDKLSCLIPAAGRFVLVTTGPGSLTPVVKRVPAQAGRVAGSCDPATAPTVGSGVTQYANSSLCEPAGTSQYWKIELHRGDTLNVNIAPFGTFGASIFLGVYGPNVGAIGNSLCGNGYSSPATVSCAIRKAGSYVLATTHAGSFTPLVTHPTQTTVTAPGIVKAGGAIRIAASIHSNVLYPTGTCVVQELSASRWSTVSRATTTTGACSARLVLTHRGRVLLRVHFVGRRGWASSTSKSITVLVR
jgi:hypothetical protein